jgi:hypothetical protein
MVGMALFAEHAHMQQRTAVDRSTQQIDCYMITVQPQSKMHSWNEWLAWLCLLLSNAHMQQRTAVVPQHAADCAIHNRTANQRCTAGMNGWHGSAHSQCTIRSSTLLYYLAARSRLCT